MPPSQDVPDFVKNILEYDRTEEPRSRESYVRAPFAWPGCKYSSLQYIIPKLPPGKIFVEGCGGSGVVTLNLDYNYPNKVFNDRHAGVTAFFRCMRDTMKNEAVRAWIENAIHSREEFIWCRDSWMNCQDDIERAARWYYMLRCSFAGLGRNWARATQGRAQAGSAMQNGLDLFPIIKHRFRAVQVENLDVQQVIRDYDSPDTVFYIDPDYIGASIYEHRVEHESMLNLIMNARGWFAVSNYKNDLYESYDWTERYSWEVESQIRSKAFTENNNLADKANVMGTWETRTETLYIREPRMLTVI